MRNFGVTSSAWDRVMGTRDEPDVLKVPAAWPRRGWWTTTG